MDGVPVRHETIPVLNDGQVIAVIERSTNLSSARTPSRMELTYLRAADDLAQMVAAGMFPCAGEAPALVRSPRVGDGLLRSAGQARSATPARTRCPPTEGWAWRLTWWERNSAG